MQFFPREHPHRILLPASVNQSDILYLVAYYYYNHRAMNLKTKIFGKPL